MYKFCLGTQNRENLLIEKIVTSVGAEVHYFNRSNEDNYIKVYNGRETTIKQLICIITNDDNVSPNEYWRGSRIGQVIDILATNGLLGKFKGFPNNVPTWHGEDWANFVDHFKYLAFEMLYMAASSFCLKSAYEGRCPGIEPSALLNWRTVNTEVGDTVNILIKSFQRAPKIKLGSLDILDMRNAVTEYVTISDTGAYGGKFKSVFFKIRFDKSIDDSHLDGNWSITFTSSIPHLQDAALYKKKAYVSADLVNGKLRLILGGYFDSDTAEAFKIWAAEQTLYDSYLIKDVND